MDINLKNLKKSLNLFMLSTLIFGTATVVLAIQNRILVIQNTNQKTYIEGALSATPIAIHTPAPSPDGAISAYGKKWLLWTKDENYVPELTVSDGKTGQETVLMKNPPQSIDPSFRDNWSPDGNFILIKLRDAKSNNNFLIFKASGDTFPSGLNYITSESLGLTDSYFLYLSWVSGGGFIGDVISINSIPSGFIKSNYIDMGSQNIHLTPTFPPGHTLD